MADFVHFVYQWFGRDYLVCLDGIYHTLKNGASQYRGGNRLPKDSGKRHLRLIKGFTETKLKQ